MELKPESGIDDIVFGLQEPDVVRLLGQPDKAFEGEEDGSELVYQYDARRMRLTFYRNEDGKLGYIRCSHPGLTFNGHPIIDAPVQEVITGVFGTAAADWDIEHYDFYDVYFHEPSWVVLNAEYGRVTDLELGATLNEDGGYNWKA
jgi:hypothetical protein